MFLDRGRPDRGCAQMIFADTPMVARRAGKRLHAHAAQRIFTNCSVSWRAACLHPLFFDPPLHCEFLADDAGGQRETGRGAGRFPRSDVTPSRLRRCAEKPQLGLRGVRSGHHVPRIYEMQGAAIFEALWMAKPGWSAPVTAEIMIPLVFCPPAEVELVKAGDCDACRAGRPVRARRGVDYRPLRVMVENPSCRPARGRDCAALRLSQLGTNEPGRRMDLRYVRARRRPVYVRLRPAGRSLTKIPFHAWTMTGVGELLGNWVPSGARDAARDHPVRSAESLAATPNR